MKAKWRTEIDEILYMMWENRYNLEVFKQQIIDIGAKSAVKDENIKFIIRGIIDYEKDTIKYLKKFSQRYLKK